jgi:phosphoglucosamine mutase
VLRNVRTETRVPDLATRLAPDVAAIEARLGDTGRVLVRPSGTEPLIRVMVEAPTREAADEAADELVAAVGRLACFTPDA